MVDDDGCRFKGRPPTSPCHPKQPCRPPTKPKMDLRPYKLTDEKARMIAERFNELKSCIVRQQPTRMKKSAMSSVYDPMAAPPKSPPPKFSLFGKLLMKSLNLGPSHIMACRRWMPSAVVWTGCITVSTVYFWLHFIINGLPEN